MKPGLSIIIPCLNEAAQLPALLAALQQQRGLRPELIVSDGGSRDQGPELARQAGAQVLTGARGRARQMNAGAAVAAGDWLLFLHADSGLTAATQLVDALDVLCGEPTRRCAGHFALEFVDQPAGQQGFFAHLERKSRSGRPGSINGDQGLLLHREFFQALGGFDESLPMLEDQRINRAIFARGRWRLLPHRLRTSARRFAHEGTGARYFLMMLIMCAERQGCEAFLASPRLYAPQAETGRLRVSPALEQILQLADAEPDFWPAMADYTLENSWQLFLALDSLPGGGRWLAGFEALLEPRLPGRLLRRPLARLLRTMFRGPIRHYWRRRDRALASAAGFAHNAS